ncbi:hypothetical protein GCM10027184_52670 [Saccharothrix stipae]
MRETTDAVRALRPQFDGLRLDVQARLFSGLGGEVSRLGDRYLPVLRDGLVLQPHLVTMCVSAGSGSFLHGTGGGGASGTIGRVDLC